MMKLTENEIAELELLQARGFIYLARDENGELFTFTDKDIRDIEKKEDKWMCEDYCEPIDKKLFKSVTWEDKDPTPIGKLLEGIE